MSNEAIKTLGTETLNNEALGIDNSSPQAILGLLHQGQVAAAQSIDSSHRQIAAAAEHCADCIGSGGNLAYIGAGSSGLMALADGLELQGTFGIPQNRIHILFAGGAACLADMKGGPEDDEDLARSDVKAAQLAEGDCAILVSASGRTPYTLAALHEAQSAGAKCVGLANNFPSPLLNSCEFPIHLHTPPELIAGSTRMGAGTAQKIALNMLSTLMGIHLGHVHDGMMVNLKADNEKLVDRAQRMVMSIANCSQDLASRSLQQADGSVKVAVLLAAGAENVNLAQQLLSANRGKLRAALAGLTVSTTSD
ncbi:MAG: N-acetylmuramic acid 6-phosphate etherase [Rhizobiaceae bacterium]